MSPSAHSPSPPFLASRLRPLVVAVAAIVLVAGSISPAIALSPASAVGPIRPVVASAEAAARPQAIGVAASAAAAATGPAPVTHFVHVVPAAPKVGPKPKAAAAAFAGSNHLLIPALGIDRPVGTFPCARQEAPANYVYRWGCAGTNNVYLLGHAYGVFKALHDAYADGRLKVGLTAIYANAAGTVHTYRVTWWRVVRPTTDAKWAWAALAAPGMTLQTCMGAHSEYRLMVRLVQVS